jgi:SulP family sulfate permease
MPRGLFPVDGMRMNTTALKSLFPFLAWFPLVNRSTLRADLLAGLTGAIIVLPQGVAFATIAGLPPQYGLYTAMVTPIVAALFGSSKHLISGPTTAISIVVFSAISHHAEAGTPQFVSWALTLTFLAGVYQLAFGIARLGALVNFVSHTVVIGFTAGAAILIATSQLKHILSIDIPRGESFIHTLMDIALRVSETNHYVVAIAVTTIVAALLTRKLLPKMPYLLFGLIAGSLAAIVLGGESRGIHYVGQIPAQLPPLSLPDFSLATIRQMAPEAFAVALLGLIEAVSIARSVASRSHQRIDGNQEFIGQGLSNIVGSFLSSYAGSGSFTRSGINYQAGARTPMSAIFSAAILMLIVLLIAPLTAYLPVSAMGGVILIVAYNLIDFHHISEILVTNRTETAILLVTFFATLLLELEFAIYLGVLLSLILFLAKTSKPEIAVLAPDKSNPKRTMVDVRTKPVPECPQLRVIRIERSVYFGSVNYLQSRLEEIVEKKGIKHILIDASRINYVDMAGANMLTIQAERLKTQGGGLYFCGLKPELWEFLAEGKYVKSIGANAFFNHKTEAIASIFKRLDKSKCGGCTRRVFRECAAFEVSEPAGAA